MNKIWEMLGIAPTNDKRAIRTAYSTLAKQCHPEEDPQGFKLLHEAYQEAMVYAGKVINTANFSKEKKEEINGENRMVEQREIQGKKLEYVDKIGENAVDMGNKETKNTEQDKEKENTDKKKSLESKLDNEQRENNDWKDFTKTSPDNPETDGREQSPSLLDRLARAKEEEISESTRSGALMKFSAILNDPKKFRKAEAWKAFFLSEDFLKEQYKESFADGMMRILEGFHTEDNYNCVQMPSGFLMELAIAYALVLNSRQSEERAANFYAREVAASIWNMQKTQYSLPFVALNKPENQVRLRSFADYIRLRDYHRRGLLTAKNQEDWKGLLHGGVINYLYEPKGKGRHEIYPGSRSVCLLDLCVFWIRYEDVPACVLEYIYKDYGLRGAEHTSTRKLYEPLKQAILSRYPNIEEALYGEDGKAKMISEWYRQMSHIISDNERFYEESEEIRERVKELFAREEWEKIRYLPELFKKIELQMFGRSVMPVSLAKYLMEYFSDEVGLQNQVWEREIAEVMTEEMIHSLYYSRMLRDMHGDVPRVMPYFAGGGLKEVYRAEEFPDEEDAIFCTDFYAGYPEVLCNQDFWHYFLMRGFGCRSVRITGREKYRRKYMVGMSASLPAYIEYLYQPSTRWQKLFATGCGGKVDNSLENSSGAERIPMPEFCHLFVDEEENSVPGAEFMLPDGKNFQIRFYLHYARYFLDGEEIFYPVYNFDEYEKFAKSISDTEQIFLLAITRISVNDYGRAQGIIEDLLRTLSLAPVSIPVIAKLLMAGEEEESVRGKTSVGSHSVYASLHNLEMAAESARYRENKQEKKTVNFLREPKGEGEKKREKENLLCSVFYLEDEELCFRAVVREHGFSIFRQMDFGWEEIYTDAFEQTEGADTLSTEEKRRAAQEFLQGLTPPAPRLRVAFYLKGLTNEKKAEKILEALKRDAKYRGSVHGLLPYAPGYPWNEEDTGRGKSAKENALKRFYREYGGFLPECYCVLRFGEDDTQNKKDHVFYASMKPFGFSLAFRALDWPSSYEHREEELHRKVKEKHWAVGHFGWGDLIGPDGESLPRIVAVGESGTYYYYDIIRMLRQENLAALLARMFDFSKVVTVENYEGELSISRFSGELEYCYGRDEFLQSVYTEKKTAADLFTVFTKAEMMGEFAVFMDGLLSEIREEPENLYFEFSYLGDGAYAMWVFAQDIMKEERLIRASGEGNVMGEELGNEDLMQGRKPLIWKIWQQSGNGEEMSRDFRDTVYWYMECGKFGKMLAGWKRIIAGFDLGEGDELVVRLEYGEKERMEWHRNKMKEWKRKWEEYFEEDEFEEEDEEEDWE